jgi:NitT/TauT family transport system substrate-binding protein
MRIGRREALLGVASVAALPLRAAAQTISTPIRIVTSPVDIFMQPFYAQDQGLFQKAGLTNVQIEFLANGSAASSAVTGGAAEFGVTSILNLTFGMLRGLPLVGVAPSVLTTANAPAGVLCVAKSSPIASPREFEGKTIAQIGLKTSADVALHAFMAKNGVAYEKIQMVETPMPEMPAGLERGNFAGAILSDPFLSDALSKGTVRVFADPWPSIAPDQMISSWVTTRQFVQNNGEVVRRVAASLVEASRWANAHPVDAIPIVARVTKIDIEVVRREKRPQYATEMRPASIQPSLDAAFRYGYIPRHVDMGEILAR